MKVLKHSKLTYLMFTVYQLNKSNKKKLNDKRSLIENFLSLSILQGVNMILPFVTLPYLVRVLEVDNFGLVNYAVSIIGYFNILVSFGFELSATKLVSIHRDNKKKISEIFSAVTCIKSVMFFISILILTLLVFLIDSLNEYKTLYYVTFGLVLGNILFPTWFFQGVEKMKFITIISVITKSLFTIFIFILVQEKNDYFYVPMLNSIGTIIGGIVALQIIFKTYSVQLYIPKKKVLIFYLKDSYYFLYLEWLTMAVDIWPPLSLVPFSEIPWWVIIPWLKNYLMPLLQLVA